MREPDSLSNMSPNSTAEERMTVAIVGLGSIGGGVAGNLCAAGRHGLVACTRRPLERFVLERPEGTVDIPLRTLTEPAQAKPVDWVFVCTKAHETASAAPWLAGLCASSTRVAVQVADITQDREYMLPTVTTVGFRTALAVPMLHDDVPIGAIVLARDRVAPFSEKHIALLNHLFRQPSNTSTCIFSVARQRGKARTPGTDDDVARRKGRRAIECVVRIFGLNSLETENPRLAAHASPRAR